MASIAAVWNKIMDRERAGRADAATGTGARVRPFANEDIYFYTKRIDNSKVRREIDPAAGQACWKMIGTVTAAAVLVVFVLMPSAYGLLAGYQIEELRQEAQRLETERAGLEIEQAALVSPARMRELAKEQHFIDPEPTKTVYLETASDTEFAQNGKK